MPYADPKVRKAYIRAWFVRRSPEQKARDLASQKSWNLLNPEKLRIKSARYRKKNPEKQAAIYRRWQQKNPEKVALGTRRRNARKRAQVHPEIDRIQEKALFVEALKLTRTTGELHTVDHIIPVIRGGWHHHDNLQILPNRVNCRKNDDLFWEMPGYKSWRDVPVFLWPKSLRKEYSMRQV